jgi:hypothetical protein
MNPLGRLALCAALAPAPVAADDEPGTPTWNLELKRQNTGRGTEAESTKTTLRAEWMPREGALSQLRLDLPLPDAKTDFEGDPLEPRLGDIKIRLSARPVRVGAPWIPYAGITFPTAARDDLGTGKYQLSPGVRATVPWKAAALGALVEHVVSFGGDAQRKDINYTKLELSVRDSWPAGYAAKVTLKPNIDWVQDGKTGAVLELEGSATFVGGWRLVLMGGHLLWGEGAQGTYGKRFELTLAYAF